MSERLKTFGALNKTFNGSIVSLGVKELYESVIAPSAIYGAETHGLS